MGSFSDTSFSQTDNLYMSRALQLAANGLGAVSPNPMVGAVIVAPDGRIIGEGYHRCLGHAHAEVNAVSSVDPADRPLIPESTIYVTLEPCSHYGKTPPCAQLLVSESFRRVVIGSQDPFDKVAGRGIEILREAGIEVSVGLLQNECQSLNAHFFTAHTLHRPFVTLKWAQSSDGFMDHKRSDSASPVTFSTPLGKVLVHRLRANHDAIGVGSGTAMADCPRLDVREWTGNNPRRITFDRRGRVGSPTPDLADYLHKLYSEGITSILVEGGPTLLKSFIKLNIWDLARIEVSPLPLNQKGCAPAPSLPGIPVSSRRISSNTIYYYSNNPLVNDCFIQNGL